MVGLKTGTLEAYCFDEAVCYFGLTIEQEMDKVSHKPTKEERRAQGARERVLDRYLGVEEKKPGGSGFADPALMFN